MRILIVGAGVIRTICGYTFSEAWHDVAHLVRPGKSERFAACVPIDMLERKPEFA